MYVKGVVAAMLIGSSLLARNKPTESPTESIESLFEDIPSRDSTVPHYNFIDLESFLEDYPEAAQEFKNLSPEDKENLLDSIDLFNDAFSEAFAEVMDSIEDQEDDLVPG